MTVISLNAYRAARSIGASDLERTAERIERRVQELRIAIRGVDVMDEQPNHSTGDMIL